MRYVNVLISSKIVRHFCPFSTEFERLGTGDGAFRFFLGFLVVVVVLAFVVVVDVSHVSILFSVVEVIDLGAGWS